MSNPAENPYVGTRTFLEEDAPRFFGREREARDLLALVAFEQVVVFYAQSGTGKSSLVNTQLIPGLEKDGRFEVLPPSRVTGEVPTNPAIRNVYVYNLMQNLTSHTVEPGILAGMRIKDFLPKLVRDIASAKRSFLLGGAEGTIQKPKRRVLIIDQFEELFTTHPEEWENRADFFEQLAEALEKVSNLWLVLVMREDYIAYLDPYAHLMPDGLRVRYYMQKMEYEDALKAVKKPAEKAGRPYKEGSKDQEGDEEPRGVAEQLVDDLRGRQIRRRGGQKDTILGQYVEPIVLQAVCSTLWESLDPEGKEITVTDLKKLGNVNKALGKYYEKRVHEVAILDKVKNLGVRESEIRNWIGTKLITPDGRRNLVVRKSGGKSEGLEDSVIQLFSEKKDLIREEGHGAASIYELTHDRLAEPILENNKEWEKDHGFPFHPQVILWSEARGRGKEVHLLGDMALEEAEKWIRKNPDQLSSIESEFLEACRVKKREEEEKRTQELQRQERELESEKERADSQARSAEQLRRALRTSIVFAVLAFLSLILTVAFAIQSNRNLRTTQMSALLNASSFEYQTNKHQGTLLAYQALTQFSDHGEVEQAVANILDKIKDSDKAQSPFNISTTINAVGSIAFNPADQGQMLAAGYADGTISLVDVGSHSPSGEILPSGHTANVASLAFSPDGGTLASGSWDTTIILWHVDTKQQIGQLQGHASSVNSLAFSPDGNILASGGADNTVILWDVQSTQEIMQLQGHYSSVSGLAFSPDGNTLASSSWDSSIILWDVSSGEIIATLSTSSQVNAIAFSPDSQILSSGGSTYSEPITLWNVAGQEPVGNPLVDYNNVYSLAFSPDGFTLASGSYGSIRLWDVARRQQIGASLAGFNNNVTSLAFSPDGTTLAAGSNAESDIILWDVASGVRMGSISPPIQEGKINVTAMSISTAGEVQGVTGSYLQVWHGDDTAPDIMEFDPVNPFPSLESIYHLNSLTSQISAFSPDGRYKVIGTPETPPYRAQIIDIETGKDISEVRHGNTVSAVAFDHQEGDLVASADSGFQVSVWDRRSGRTIAQINSDIRASPVSLSFSPDSSRIVIAYADEHGTVEVWDIATNQRILIIADRKFKPLGYTVPSPPTFDSEENETARFAPDESAEQTQNPLAQVGNLVADVAYLKDGLYILYNNGTRDKWEIWPSRDELKNELFKECDPCELTNDDRETYGLFTWPMRMQDYSGYSITIFMVLLYGFGIRTIYSKVLKKPTPAVRIDRSGFTWRKFLSASAQGTAVLLIGLLGWGILGHIEPLVYREQARSTEDVIQLFLIFLLPLGLWAGGAYSHLTRRQTGKSSGRNRALIGMLSGILAGLLAEWLGLMLLRYLAPGAVDSYTQFIQTPLLISGFAGGLMSLISSFAYVFLLQPWLEERRVTREGQYLLQFLFGAGMFFEQGKTIRKWIYPLGVVEMIGFWLLVPPFDIDYSYFSGDIMDDGTAAALGLIGFIIYLIGLNDLRRSIKYKDQAQKPKSLISAFVVHLILGAGLFYARSKSLRKWVYPVALLFILIGFVDLDYNLLGFDIMPDSTAADVGIFALLVYAAGFIDTWLAFRKFRKSTDSGQSVINHAQATADTPDPSSFEVLLQTWWRRGLITWVVGFLSGILLISLDSGYMDLDAIGIIATISTGLGVFGLLFYPHRTSINLLAGLGIIGAFAWFPLVDSLFVSLWFGLGSGLIVSAIISRILHARKKI